MPVILSAPALRFKTPRLAVVKLPPRFSVPPEPTLNTPGLVLSQFVALMDTVPLLAVTTPLLVKLLEVEPMVTVPLLAVNAPLLVKLVGVTFQAPPVVEAIVPLLMIGALLLVVSAVVPVPELCSVIPGPILRV